MSRYIPSRGEKIAPLRILVSAEAMKLWADALGDPNPIHLDPAAVRRMGLGDRVINQGPANLAYIFNLLSERFPGATLEHSNVRFLDNSFGGEELIAEGKVTEVTSVQEGSRIECDVALSSVEGRPILVGEASLLLRHGYSSTNAAARDN